MENYSETYRVANNRLFFGDKAFVFELHYYDVFSVSNYGNQLPTFTLSKQIQRQLLVLWIWVLSQLICPKS